MGYFGRIQVVRLIPYMLAFCGIVFAVAILPAQQAFACVPVMQSTDVSGGSCSDSDCSSFCLSFGGGGGFRPPQGIVTPLIFQKKPWEPISYSLLYNSPVTPLSIFPVTIFPETGLDALEGSYVQATRYRGLSIELDVLGGN